MTAHALIFQAYSNYPQICSLHLMTGCIYSLRISRTINFIWAVCMIFSTVGSDVISKCCLLTYYLAVFKVFLQESLSSLQLSAFFKFYVYCLSDYNFCAATIALICATSPKGVVINEVSILGSVRMFQLSVIGSFGFLNQAYPCANTQRTPIEHAPDVCQCRHNVVLYFWLNNGFIF